jgi:hypothetical protein
MWVLETHAGSRAAESAALALANLCVRNSGNCDELRRVGALEAMVRLLKDSGPGHPAARRVAAALAVACNHNPDNQLALQVAGGLQVRARALVRAMSHRRKRAPHEQSDADWLCQSERCVRRTAHTLLLR